MRLIDADQLLQKLQKDPLFPLVEQYGITRVIEAAPTIAADTDAETRGYIRGYNDAIETTFKLMLQYGSDREEEEHER